MIWAAYWAPSIAEKLGLIEEFARGDVQSIGRMANVMRPMATYAEREQKLSALRVAYELSKLF